MICYVVKHPNYLLGTLVVYDLIDVLNKVKRFEGFFVSSTLNSNTAFAK